MLKRTLFFSNPFHLSVRDCQLVATPKPEGNPRTIPIEDIGFVVIDHAQISVTPVLLEHMVANNVAVIFCDGLHHPQSMLLNLNGHHLQNEHFRQQISISEPLKKNLWKQTVEAKIINQAALLKKLGKDHLAVEAYAKQVKSGDTDNREGAAAREYWKTLMGPEFTRARFGMWPNPPLNYGYAILRAAVARALVGSGLLPTLGIHHHSRYNAYCLADDIMEPYRPYVDETVYHMYLTCQGCESLTTQQKAELLNVLTIDVAFERFTRPLMVGLSQTTASLTRCYAGDVRKIAYPKLDQPIT
ncbi:MAG: type II CRISPR-associated endonuclease Cas1 [Cyclobacteriaceae bacterium]|nr:type II CRISPR-associated endonuclease Cas1 [Cyclobacteriaceae bacterium]